MSDIFFTADMHFGHQRILEFCSNTRRGNTVDEHDEFLIEAWNSVVKKGDMVYILGDECLGDRDKGYKNIARLNGAKHLIRGNHTQLKKQEHKDLFQDIRDYKRVSIEKIPVVMMHYPIWEWDSMQHGAFMLFGHVHAGYNTLRGKSMNVGIDTRPNRDMKPWSWEEVKEFMKDKPIVKHHGD